MFGGMGEWNFCVRDEIKNQFDSQSILQSFDKTKINKNNIQYDSSDDYNIQLYMKEIYDILTYTKTNVWTFI